MRHKIHRNRNLFYIRKTEKNYILSAIILDINIYYMRITIPHDCYTEIGLPPNNFALRVKNKGGYRRKME